MTSQEDDVLLVLLVQSDKITGLIRKNTATIPRAIADIHRK
jgi:hypothetical protein